MKNSSAFILALIFVLQISCRSKDEITISVFEGQLSITAGGGANFSNRINDFKTIETINGDVYIKNFGNSYLSFLKNIKTINGNLNISETEVTDLDFFSSLETVNGSIKFSINKKLISTKGLENLKKAKGLWLHGDGQTVDLNPIKNVAISDFLLFQYLANDSFPFFKNVTSLKNYLIIGNCNFKDFKGLANLSNVDGNFSLSENNNILDLEGLNKLVTVGQLDLFNNKKLETLKGLENLKTVNKTLNIVSMSLKSISALNNLESIKSFTMAGTQCESLKGLDNLLNCSRFQIYANPKLTNFCALRPFLTMNLGANLNTDWNVFDNLQNLTPNQIRDKCQ